MKSNSETPRVALMSLRNLEAHVARSHGYEFEDVIFESLESATLFAPKPSSFSKLATRAKTKLSNQRKLARALPSGLQSLSMSQDYALFFFSAAYLRDLNFLSSIKGWRQRSGKAVCWLQELWIDSLADQTALVEQLNDFDLVVCSFADTTSILQDKLRVPVIYMPWGVDMMHFCPTPNPPRRVIDVLNIGIRNPETQKALVEHTDRTGQFYLYETISGRGGMKDYRVHRHNYVGQLQRSRYFFSYLAKMTRTQERGQQMEFGLRYIEGAAAGTVILGAPLDSDAFQEHLGWEDAVIDVPFDCPKIGEVLEDLDAQPDRMEAIRARNVVECLKRHDHLHRWENLLAHLKMEPHAKLIERKQALEGLIQQSFAE